MASDRGHGSSRREAPAHPRPSPARAPEIPEAPEAEIPAPVRPRPAQRQAPEDETIAQLFRVPGPASPEAERLAWSESALEHLLHPGDHPCAGLPRAGVSRELLIGAAEQQLDELYASASSPEAPAALDLDAIQCHLQGNWSVYPLNDTCARGLDRSDPESVARFIACTDALPQDPTRHFRKSIWLPCPADDPRATTMRQFFRGRIAAQVDDLFTQPTCGAN